MSQLPRSLNHGTSLSNLDSALQNWIRPRGNPQKYDDEQWKRVVERYAQLRQSLAEFEVEPSDWAWTGGADFDAIFPHECYKQALIYSLSSTRHGHTLVHGTTSLDLGGHAWVELPGEFVFDGVFQRFYRRDAYYGDMARAIPWYSYDETAVSFLSQHFKHDPGSWPGMLDLPTIADRPPINISLEYAKELLDAYYVRSGEDVLKKLSKEVLLGLAKRCNIEVTRSITKPDLITLLLQDRKCVT